MNRLQMFMDDKQREIRDWQELTALRAFVREIACQDPGQPTGQRESNKSRAEDLCEEWKIS